ncbi:hypothetical protein FRB98_001341 [Tulasnella sp. 332]|nr:hypothetical protein FRB98_001341 [Tulasnella sp. 332]
MKLFAIGASRNIGYFTALTLLQQGHQVVFLLRRLNVFDDDPAMKPFMDSGSAKLVQGDASVVSDMSRAWATATSDGPVDTVLFSVGAIPSFSFTKFDFALTVPDLCTAALINTLTTIPSAMPQPRVIAITSMGITKDSHRHLPYLLRPLYAVIRSPHADKLGMERVVHYSAGWTPEWKENEPIKEVLAPGWETKLPEKGWLKHAVIVRPAILTDGEALAKYRVGDHLKASYTISRKDVAHFITNDLLENWEKYDGKAITVGN